MATLPDKGHGMTNQLMHLTLGKGEIAMPFGQEIFLLHVHIAGTGFYDAPRTEGKLKSGQELVLIRQPDNPHDKLAIEVFTPDGKKLGYVPRKDNTVIARLLDAGKIITAKITHLHCEAESEWVDITVDLVMKEI